MISLFFFPLPELLILILNSLRVDYVLAAAVLDGGEAPLVASSRIRTVLAKYPCIYNYENVCHVSIDR